MQRIDQSNFTGKTGQYISPYGSVLYSGTNKSYKTRAHDSAIEEIPDHEGEFLYEFNNEFGAEARLQIRTRLDLEFFLARPALFEVYNPAGKLISKPKPEPEAPKPPKAEAPNIAEPKTPKAPADPKVK